MLTRSSGAALLTPQEVGDLVVRPTLAAAVCTQVARVILTDAASFRVPVVADDPAAAWTPEGAEIAVSDGDLDEVVVVPQAVKALSVISNELASDSSPAALQVVGDGIVRSLARRLDQAFFAGLPSPAPAGLATLAGVQPVDAGEAWGNLDAFAEAASLAEQEGAALTSWVTSPATAQALATLKSGAGSNVPLLAPGGDPALPTRRLLEGLPLFISSYVAPNTVWALDGTRSMVVVRSDADVVADPSPLFTSDRTAIRGVLRAGFAFAHPASVVKVSIDA